MTTDPDMARDDDTTGWGWEDGWYIRPPRSDYRPYMDAYDAGYNARCEADIKVPEPSPQPPDEMDPRCHGDAEDHEERFMGTVTGRRKLERACNEGDF